LLDFVAGDKIGLTGMVSDLQLDFEAVSLQLDGGATLASTAIKSGSNYLGTCRV
jgi:hypothetical protein